MSNANTLKALRKIALRPAIEDGTVVRFKVTYGEDAYARAAEEGVRGTPIGGRSYSYTATLLSGWWYTTAQVRSTLDDGSTILNKMSQTQFAGVLASPQVSDIQVAVTWESL